MGKFKEFKEAIKNPPADRLAKIEYQSHLLQALGITFVSIVLIIRGLWFIIFAFIFALGINYSQGMTAYKKYKNIKEFMPKEEPKNYKKDISPSRRRSKIIEYEFGKTPKWAAIISSVLAVFVMELTFNTTWLIRSLTYPLFIGFMFWLIYFVLFYRIANKIYIEEFGE